jgi:transcriptional regulator with XRE-family HTH domain
MVRGKNAPWVNALRLTFAKNVRLARERAGLSQRDLCGTTGIAQAYLSQVENGRWNVGLDNIMKIAVAVGVAPHDLLDPSFGKEGRDSPADSKATGQRKP